MSVEDKALRALEALARRIGDRSPTQVARVVKDKVQARAQRTTVRVLDGLVSRLSGRPVHTGSGEGLAGWLAERSLPSTPSGVPRSANPPPPTPPTPAPPTPAPTIAPAPAAELPLPVPELVPEPAVRASAPVFARRSEPPHGRFGLDRVVLLLREPSLAFAYWEIDPLRIQSAAASAATRAELRLIDADDERLVQRLEVAASQGRTYLSGFAQDRSHRVELLLLKDDGSEVVLSRSRVVSPDALRTELPRS